MSKEEYIELQSKFADPDIFDAARERFFQEHPDCPKPKPIERLDLIMRKEYARQIIEGTKTVEFRTYTPHYCDCLYDKAVLDYEDAHWNDELMRLQMIDFNDSVRAVKTIHFHNYGNTWFLDVECIDNNTVIINDEQVGFLQDDYDCHELDQMLDDLNKKKAKERPILFYFALGKILETNLANPRK